MKGDSEEWRSGWGGLIGWGDGWVLAERCSYARVYARSRTRSFVFFAVTSVTADGIENTSSSPKRRIVLWKVTCRFIENDVSFYRKQRVVLWKVTYRFMENNVSFCWKQRVVFDWRSKSSFEDGVLVCFWDGVAAWKCDIFWMLFLLSV